MVALLLVGTMAYAIAEEITLTTYYPSPRGVYNELRTKGDVAIGKLDPPAARLEIVGEGATSGTSALRIKNVDGANLLEVQNGGSVGIGTQNPGSGYSNLLLEIQTSPSRTPRCAGPFLRLQHAAEPGGRDWWIGSAGSCEDSPDDLGTLQFWNGEKGAGPAGIALVIRPNGNVGIGTSRPTEKLHVSGGTIRTDALLVNAAVQNTSQFADTVLTVGGSAYVSNSVYAASDLRFKTNLAPLTSALDTLERIRGVRFEWNELAGSFGHRVGQAGVGVIAQDVEAVLPELVLSWGAEEYKAIDYSKLTAVLIEAIKELKLEQATLKQRIEVLERRSGE